MANPTSPEIGSPLNASVVTGEAEFYVNSGVAGVKLGNIKMHKNAGKVTTKDRAVAVRGGGKRLAARTTTMIELVYDIELDEQTLENMAFVLFGTATQSGYVQSLVAAPSVSNTITAPTPRNVYDLGKLNIVTVVVVNSVPHTYVETTDYVVDYQRGTIYIVDGGAIVPGTPITVTCGCAAVTMDTIVANNVLNLPGRLVLYESDLFSPTFKRVWDGKVQLTASGFPEENGDFSKFQLTCTFLTQPTIKQRQWVAS